MERVNKMVKGVHQDNDPRFQPEDTMRDSLNGRIMSVGNNRFAWRPMSETEFVFELNDNEKIFGHCRIKTRFILLVMNTDNGLTKILEVMYDENINVTLEERWSKANNPFNLSESFPIRRMIGFYETEEIQRIYFTDFNNQPRVINIGNQLTVTINEKFVEFYPVIEHIYGIFSLSAILSGGNRPAGNYFFCWQYYTKDGYYTDWSYLSNPISLTGKDPGQNSWEYQQMEGQGPDVNTGKSIQIKISKIDTDYDSIRVAAFYSNDYNSAGTGVVFFDSDISGSEMEIVYSGGENVDTITIDDLTNHSTVIEKVKDMTFVKKRNVIAVMKERDELDLTGLPGGKNNQVLVDISHENYEILLDFLGSEITEGASPNRNAMFASPSVILDRTVGYVYANLWYKVTSIGGLSYTDTDSVVHTHAHTERFKPAKFGTVTSGTYIQIIRKKLYKIKTSIPAVPAGLTATKEIGQIRLRWSDVSSKEDNYNVYYRVNGVIPWEAAIVLPADTTEYIFVELDHTILYDFYVTASNTEGESAGTSIVTQRSAPAIPSTPSNFARINGINKIDLSWTDTSSVTEYFEVWYKRAGIFYLWLSSQKETILAGTNVFEFLTSNYYSYEFRIRACNESGCSAYSATITGTALMPAPTVAPSPVNVSQFNCGGVTVSWSSVLHATGYQVERYNGSTWDVLVSNHATLSYYDSFYENEDGVYAKYRVKGKNSSGDGPYGESSNLYIVCILGGGGGGMV